MVLTLTPASADGVAKNYTIAENLENYKLDNGLEVIVIPDHRAPVVTHMLWYRVGSADDPQGQSGIAHFFEHLMFSGTINHPDSEFSEWVSSVGGQENAMTSYDYTAYFQRLSKQHLRQAMEFESDRMKQLTLSDDIIERERKVVLEERSLRVESNPGALLGEEMDASLFAHHPYRIPIIGWRHEIEALTKEQLVAFYNQYYWPNNAVLIVVGDVDPNEVLQMAEDTYGKISANPQLMPRQRVIEPEMRASKSVRFSDTKVQQSYLIRRYKVASYRQADSQQSEALDIIARILGVGSSSRLYQKLVVEDKIATDTGAYYMSDRYDSGLFVIYGLPAEGVSLDDLEKAIDEVIDHIKQNGIEEQELSRAKQTLVESSLFAMDNQDGLARIFGRSLMAGTSVEDIQSWPENIKSVSKDKLEQVLRDQIEKSSSVTGMLLPAD